MNKIILNNPIVDYLIVSGILMLIFLFKKRASKNITRLVFFIFRKLGRNINEKEFFDLVLAPLENFIVFLTIELAFSSLTFPNVFKFTVMKISSAQIVEGIATGLVIFFFFHTILRVIDYMAIVMEKKANQSQDFSDNQLVIFFREFLKVLVIIICILVIIRYVFHQDITKLLAGLSLAGAAIALAAKESLENLIASFIIFFDKPFGVGDILRVNQVVGTVEKIGLRSTRIRTVEKTYVTIPNKQMVDSIVDNISQGTKRRHEMQLQIELKVKSTELKSLIEELQLNIAQYKTENVSVFMADIRPDAYVITIEYFSEMLTLAEFNALKQQINLNVLHSLENRGIGMAGKDKIIAGRLYP
jgi:MscS family membrane protein